MASPPHPNDAHEEALAFFSDAHALNVEAMAQVIANVDADLLKMRGFEPFLATSPFSHTVYWFLSAHLGAGNFRLNSLMSVEHI